MSTNMLYNDKYDYHLKEYHDVEIEYAELEGACYKIEEKLSKYRRKKSFFESFEYNEYYSDKIDRYNYKIENLLILKDIMDNIYNKLIFK